MPIYEVMNLVRNIVLAVLLGILQQLDKSIDLQGEKDVCNVVQL